MLAARIRRAGTRQTCERGCSPAGACRRRERDQNLHRGRFFLFCRPRWSGASPPVSRPRAVFVAPLPDKCQQRLNFSVCGSSQLANLRHNSIEEKRTIGTNSRQLSNTITYTTDAFRIHKRRNHLLYPPQKQCVRIRYLRTIAQPQENIETP